MIRIPAITIARPGKLAASLYALFGASGALGQLVQGRWNAGALSIPAHQETASSAGEVLAAALWFVCVIWIATPKIERAA